MKNEVRAYLDGKWIPANQARLSVTDGGFVLGVTLAEQLRTFGGQLFELSAHLKRLEAGWQHLGWDPPHSTDSLAQIAQQLATHNHAQLAAGDDLGLCIFITPGTYPTYADGMDASPVVGMHTYPLPFARWAAAYQQGVSIVTVDVRQVPDTCWPASLKCRSRMHYYRASQAAHQQQAGATALLLDHAGHVSETPTANVVAFDSARGLVSPPRNEILPGISLDFLFRLAADRGIPVHERQLTPDDLYAAEEVWLTSTPYCLLPVKRLDHRSWPNDWPAFGQLLGDWSRRVQRDIAQQARQFSDR